jgi:hypothetical protein
VAILSRPLVGRYHKQVGLSMGDGDSYERLKHLNWGKINHSSCKQGCGTAVGDCLYPWSKQAKELAGDSPATKIDKSTLRCFGIRCRKGVDPKTPLFSLYTLSYPIVWGKCKTITSLDGRTKGRHQQKPRRRCQRRA